MGDTLTYQGIGHIEAQDRVNEHRTGVPNRGAGAALLSAQTRRTARVQAINAGEADAHLRMRHAGSVKQVTNEHLAALSQPGNKFIGGLQFKSIVPSSVSITNGGAPLTIVDNGAGVLHDTGLPLVTRGTIDYVKGTISLTYGAAPTAPVRATYQHNDYADFASPSQVTTKASAALPFTVQTGFGRVNPGAVSIVDGTPSTWVDDGKGNIIHTTGGVATVGGSIDYATGVITLFAPSPVLAGTVTVTYTFNPFGGIAAKAAGCKLMDMMGEGSLPELTAEPWADGIKGELTVALWGESRDTNKGTNLVTMWTFFGEEPYRVREEFSGFPPGGHSNDSRLDPKVLI
jgi:hypothetical protein